MITNSKNRLLFLKDLFEEYTDAENGLTVKDIQKLYYQNFLTTPLPETVVDDIHALEDYGMDILHTSGNRNDYRLMKRKDEITPHEIRIMVDLLQTTRALPDDDVKVLVDKLENLCSIHERKRLCDKVYVAATQRTTNKEIPNMLKTLFEAIDEDKQVRFKYYHYDMAKKKDYLSYGSEIRVSPFAVIYRDGLYKLLAIRAGKEKLALFRLEQMEEVSISRAVRLNHNIFEKANLNFYTKANYYEDYCSPKLIELQVHCSVMDDVVERYGTNIKTSIIDDEHVKVEVFDFASPDFHTWILSSDRKIKIIAPKQEIHRLIMSTRYVFYRPSIER